MFKEKYEKPVMTPAENSIQREQYQRPDMEVVDLGMSTVIITDITSTVPRYATTTTTIPTTVPTVTTTTVVPATSTVPTSVPAGSMK